MKQETNTMQTKEGLHLDRRLSGIYSGDNLIATLDLSDGNYSVYGDEIVKAVNERKALLDALEKLHESAINLLVEIIDIPHPTSMEEDMRKLSEALKTAKQTFNNAK